MKKKGLVIAVVALVVWAVFICVILFQPTFGYQIKKILLPSAERIQTNYFVQNTIFFDAHTSDYDQEQARYAQINIGAYSHYTGKVVTQQDIKTFLQKDKNPDGSPRTYEDDETGKIRDFVTWCAFHNNEVNSYGANLSRLQIQYCQKHPEFKQYLLQELNIQQIAELEKQLQNPSYSPKL